jgi:large subunit ribosomal protein L25
MQYVALEGQVRNELGKKTASAARQSSEVPCVLYGGGSEALHFSVETLSLRDIIYTPEFRLANLTVGGKAYQALVKSVQYHPVTDQIMHVDFLRLEAGRKVNLEVPLRLTGQSVGAKKGGKILQKLRKIKIKTVVENLVDHLTVDISALDLGQSARVRDIVIPNNVEIVSAGSIPVVTIEIPRALRSAAAAEAAAATKGKKK